jgi:hypothetical protein
MPARRRAPIEARLRTSIASDNTFITVAFAGDVGSLRISLDDLPIAIIERLSAFGLARRLSNVAVKAASPEEASRAIVAEVERLKRGQWGIRPRGERRYSMLARAVATQQGVSVSDAHDFIRSLESEDRQRLMHSPAIRAAMQELQRSTAEGKARDKEAAQVLAQLCSPQAA